MGGPIQRKNISQESNDFTQEERERIAKLLRQPLKANLIKKRAGHGGKNTYYIDGGTSYSLANDIFGFDGWKSQIINTQIDYAKEKQKNSNRWYIGVSVIVRVELKNGSYHEDLGFGEAINIKGRGAALQKAKKEAVTDATKRALRVFGNGLGNCLRLKWYLEALRKGKSFQDLQEEDYTHGDLLDPETGGRAVEIRECESPQEEKSAPIALDGNPEFPLPHAAANTTPPDEKDELTCPFTQSTEEYKPQILANLKKNPNSPDTGHGNGLKRNREKNQDNEKKQAPQKRRFGSKARG